ncbi:hypothetical protein KNP414_01061 [Paenibacillus mucilaginosus KNP414]|uniref:Uncharacterized protein n=1 Tax=Paenibacillus mucilaginosus (strain KNP414) TaxID=1036673 RepID=F8FCQ7_PAEMK|nr:hypothetical protein KNP414_01061 [Paenibacillus mucilaginosus KNP414]
MFKSCHPDNEVQERVHANGLFLFYTPSWPKGMGEPMAGAYAYE